VNVVIPLHNHEKRVMGEIPLLTCTLVGGGMLSLGVSTCKKPDLVNSSPQLHFSFFLYTRWHLRSVIKTLLVTALCPTPSK